MFKWFKSFCQTSGVFLFGSPTPKGLHESPYAKACTPDQLIAAHIIEKMATDFGGWKIDNIGTYKFHETFDWEDPPYNTTHARLIYGDDLKIEAKFVRYSEGSGTKKEYYYVAESVVVNGVSLSLTEGREIMSRYKQLKDAYDEAQKVAAEEKKRMEENEKKWNLAETLLGMKRNEQGALIPATNYEED